MSIAYAENFKSKKTPMVWVFDHVREIVAWNDCSESFKFCLMKRSIFIVCDANVSSIMLVNGEYVLLFLLFPKRGEKLCVSQLVAENVTSFKTQY